MNFLLLGALVVYGFFLIFFVVWSFFLIYHLLRFSPRREVARWTVAIYGALSFFLLLATAVALARLDWSTPFRVPALL